MSVQEVTHLATSDDTQEWPRGYDLPSGSPLVDSPQREAESRPQATSPASGGGMPSKREVSPVERLQRQVREAEGMVRLQSEQVLLDVLSEKEMNAERRSVEKVRKTLRDQRIRVDLEAAKQAARKLKVESKLARMEVADQLWHQQALSQRKRLTDPSSRLADLYRWHKVTTRVLLALIVIGIAWASVNVQQTLTVGVPTSDPLFWLSYAIEPLISFPLIVLMILQSTAARWGRKFRAGKLGAKGVIAIEVVLLTLTMFLNSAPYMPGTGEWVSLPIFVGHMVPPIMIAVAVLLQPIAADFFANLLVQAHVAADSEDSRLSEETDDVIGLVNRIRSAIAEGLLTCAPGEAYPSISQTQKVLNVGKARVQKAHDAMKKLDAGARL